MHPLLRCMCTCSTPCRLWHSVHQRKRSKLMRLDSAIIVSTNWPSTELLLKGTWPSLWPAKDISQFVDRIIIGHSRIPWPVSGNSKTKIKIITSVTNTSKNHDHWRKISISFGKTVFDHKEPQCFSRLVGSKKWKNRRLLVYVIPVTLLSFALNIPKFIEVSMCLEIPGCSELFW